MHRRLLLTVLRGFLLSLFVLGGPGLPLVDAVLWHGSSAQQVAGSRADAPGAARTHADACSLAAPLPVPGPVPCNASPVPILRAVERVASGPAQSVRAAAGPGRGTRSRAPPALRLIPSLGT